MLDDVCNGLVWFYALNDVCNGEGDRTTLEINNLSHTVTAARDCCLLIHMSDWICMAMHPSARAIVSSQ